MTDTCPHCGSRILMRHGVRLYPKWADFYDFVAARKDGVLGEQLIWVFWPDKPKKQAQNVLHQTVTQINSLLAPNGVKIAAGGKGLPYRVWGAP